MTGRAQLSRFSLPPSPLEGEGRGGGYRAAGFVEKKHPLPHAANSLSVRDEAALDRDTLSQLHVASGLQVRLDPDKRGGLAVAALVIALV